MLALSIFIVFALSTLFGVTLLLSYLVARMLRSDGWDDSNMTNALRLLSHVAMHPEDFVHMYYVDGLYSPDKPFDYDCLQIRKAFPYLSKDELSEVVKTRPTTEERR